jgi:hypothetical protein
VAEPPAIADALELDPPAPEPPLPAVPFKLVPAPPPPADVIELNTELLPVNADPEVPPAPPAPTVTVKGDPVVTAKPVAVL